MRDCQSVSRSGKAGRESGEKATRCQNSDGLARDAERMTCHNTERTLFETRRNRTPSLSRNRHDNRAVGGKGEASSNVGDSGISPAQDTFLSSTALCSRADVGDGLTKCPDIGRVAVESQEDHQRVTFTTTEGLLSI
ncbi:hypothetical protein HPB50_003119 [Hyalomma asiaticum]|uniref:Uncharacterized protein n=1 Tax=Hyalomma asiaticum TaxID=266040 RepID=A0ACB7S6A6_HYAAI|nr:hypothetical protein HPB50_003119 [Hyalomma asiaticum]